MVKRHRAGGECRGARCSENLRDRTDIDSGMSCAMDGLHKELGIEIPDTDVAKFTTWNGCVNIWPKAGKT
jgi:hypothetical protein